MTQAPLFPLTITSFASDVLADRCVTQSGAYPAPGGNSFGITDKDINAGEDGVAVTMGTKIATAGAAIAFNILLEVGAEGKLIPHNTGVAVARSMSTATSDGSKFEVFLLPN